MNSEWKPERIHREKIDAWRDIAPLYEVIADYPDNKDFPKGKIIHFERWNTFYWAHYVEDCQGKREWLSTYFDKYPHLFKNLRESPAPQPEGEKHLMESTDPRIEEHDIAQEKVWMEFIDKWQPGQVNSGLGEALQKKFKEGDKEAFAADVLRFISQWDTPVAVMYGPQERRFCDDEREFTPEEIVTLYKSSLEKEGKKI